MVAPKIERQKNKTERICLSWIGVMCETIKIVGKTFPEFNRFI